MDKLLKPRYFHSAAVRDIAIAMGVLIVVVVAGVVVGVRIPKTLLEGWGGWLSALISGLALIGSVYAIIRQARQGESTSWNIALARLGEVYDLAQSDELLARILTEATESEFTANSVDPDDLEFSPKQTVWLCSLFLAFEQIYVATKALSPESQRVWRLYLRNQLNKPTIRAAFVRDSSNKKDYHNDFWTFVRGEGGKDGYRGYAIDPKFFSASDDRTSHGTKRRDYVLTAKEYTEKNLLFWQSLYADSEIARQMYSPDNSDSESLLSYLTDEGHAFTAYEGDTPVGAFTIRPVSQTIASFGLMIHSDFRGKGYGNQLLKLVQSTAITLGYRTLRGDVYCDNFPCIGLLYDHGFRKFMWFEKNIVDATKAANKALDTNT